MGLTEDHLQGAFKNPRDWNNSIDKWHKKSGSGQVILTGRKKVIMGKIYFLQRTATHRPAPIHTGPSTSSSHDKSVILVVDDDITPSLIKKVIEQSASSVA